MTNWGKSDDEYQFYFEDGEFSVDYDYYLDGDCGVYFSITKHDAVD